jgi:hypothetical protein
MQGGLAQIVEATCRNSIVIDCHHFGVSIAPATDTAFPILRKLGGLGFTSS